MTVATDASVTTRLGDRIGLARRWARVDAQELAKEVGVARKTVASWEDCRTEPTLSQLRQIASTLEAAFQVAGVPITAAKLKVWIEDGEAPGGLPLTKWYEAA